MKVVPLGLARVFTNKHKISVERLARDKHSSLSRTFINYDRIKFYYIDPGSTLKICNIRHKNRQLGIKLVSYE
jgi:hypothetical protein